MVHDSNAQLIGVYKILILVNSIQEAVKKVKESCYTLITGQEQYVPDFTVSHINAVETNVKTGPCLSTIGLSVSERRDMMLDKYCVTKNLFQ